MILLVQILFSGVFAHAQEMAFLSGAFPPPTFSFTGESQYTGAPANGPRVGFDEQKFTAAAPVVIKDDDAYSVTAKGQQTHLGDRLTFADRGVSVPDRFGSADIGVSWMRRETADEDDKYGASISVGSAGPRALADVSKPNLNAMVSLEHPAANGNAWVFFVAYSNNRAEFNNIPLPGGAYLIKGEFSTVLLGVPFFFAMYRPDPWLLLTTITPVFANAEAGYRFWGPLQVYANTSWQPKAYQNLLESDGDHLIFEKKEMGAGLRLFLSRQISFSAGWTRDFDRRFLLGKSLWKPNSSTIRIEDAEGFQMRAKIAF